MNAMKTDARARRLLAIAFLAATATAAAAPPRAAAQEQGSSPVGVPVWLRDLVLAGTELEVRPVDETTPIVARIASVNRHGAAFRYDIVYYGLDPGTYDLRDFLRRSDGSTTDDLAPIPLTIRSVLPPGQVEPNQLRVGLLPRLGGYRALLWAGGVLWLGVLWAILRAGRERRAAAVLEARPPTLAERLRPLVEQALAGELSRTDRAELELALIAFWRERLGLEETGAAEALHELRAHAEAGPLLRGLEDWLHRPEPPADVDVEELLAPYRNVAADALEAIAAEPARTTAGAP